MTPTVTLYQGDCLEVLKDLPSGSVDCVITDPPYSEKTHRGARTTTGTMRPGALRGNPGLVANKLDFAFAEVDLLRDVLQLARPKRWVVMTLDWRHCLPLEEAPPDGLEFVRFGIWDKPRYCPQFTGDRPATGWEAIAILHPPGKKRWNGGGKRAVWVASNEHGSPHPAAKPLKLILQLIRDFTDPGETILDPFMGSGTTGVACVQTGRNFIGIEIDPGYFAIAERRIAEAQQQLTL